MFKKFFGFLGNSWSALSAAAKKRFAKRRAKKLGKDIEQEPPKEKENIDQIEDISDEEELENTEETEDERDFVEDVEPKTN